MSAVKGAVVDGDLAAEIGRWAATGAVVYGIASGAHVFAVGALPIPEGPPSTAAWVNAFIDQVRPILPGGIEPVGVLSNATRDGADVDLTFSTDERGALRCLRRSASSTVAVPVKTQPGLASSLHCLTGVIDIGSHDLPFPSTREVAAQRLSESISAYMAKALFLIDGKQVAAEDSSSVSSLGNKDGEHSVEFLVSTLMSTPVSPPRVRFSGSQQVLAYVLPTASITEAVRAVVDDVTRSSLHRLRVFSEDSPTEWSWAPDDASEGRKPAVFHLPRRLPFPVGHVRLSDYAFPGESVDEVNERVDEFTGRSNAFESFGAVVEEFPTIDEQRPPVPQAIVRSTPAAKPSFLDLRLLFVLVVPIVIALLVTGTWRLH